ncbi:NACHT, LRR and PYD domains-containing protein 3 [Triplophysa tibetana]|uniref:NACHT, LRR and PYD domains-containing protein 3 n=1 Tax=Triplophysa tibetana TaxID=1572043 RepID=A0A5A9NQ74_9TELE|nr:NACHT, LRR and PYD domains-containing protein 3 [Triplophysa tibetana]
MKRNPRRTQDLQDTPIYCNEIFKPLPISQNQEKIKSVLTKGIAGIGKTVSVQKFILDWAEGRANQDVDFMFVLPFRELNLIQDGLHPYSLHKLLLDFHPELQDVDAQIYEECKVVFIFDGLDESRMTQMFSDDSEKVSNVTDASTVAELMSNLIKGDLLPSALIWITSRPAAANQIPSKYITRVTEIQGFSDAQKEEYFRKRISDEHQARRIMSHIRRARSLHIMCHIPVFCWISSTVLQKILTQDHSEEIPKTLSEMYIHFLLIQMKMKNEKYDPERDPEINREVIVKLAEVAFKQLMKGNVMFYEEDLIECGIDITDASLYSGICTEIFKEESVIHQRKIYSFIHLSCQEFLAAFYLFYSHVVKNVEVLKCFLGPVRFKWYIGGNSSYEILQSAVNTSLRSKNGRLDLFLRFLLGISLESNQRLLQDLLTHTENTLESVSKAIKFIHDRIRVDHLTADKCINLFLCLVEINDQTLFGEIQEKNSMYKLSPSYCSAIAYMLQMSEDVQDEFDLRKYKTTQEGRRRLIPAVINCRKALLADCNLTDPFYECLASALYSSNSLRELDLSNNDLQDSGVKLLCDGLKSSHCQLEILRLVFCNLQDLCCESLVSVLQSLDSLRELDLSNNDLQDSGVKLLSDALKSHNFQLQILRLSGCMVTEKGCHYLASALSSNPSHLRELDLSYNHPGPTGVQLLSLRLNDPKYTLNKLNVDHGDELMITSDLHQYACDLTLDPNTANNRLTLSNNNRTVTSNRPGSWRMQEYSDHPERFDFFPQVLCRVSLTGRCYWEVKLSMMEDVAVTYKGIGRKGRERECKFECNEKSWKLKIQDSEITACHNDQSVAVHAPSRFNTVAVFLDWSAGTLSFYRVSKKQRLTLLHTFNTTFTEPLYAGFTVNFVSAGGQCEIISPSARHN